MKKLQVMIDDEMMVQAKTYVAKHGITLKDLVSDLLLRHFDSKEESIIVSKNHSIIPKKEESIKVSNDTNIIESKEQTGGLWDIINAPNDPMDERYFYILPKTHRIDPMYEDDDTWVTNSKLRWLIPKGCSKHFDKQGNLIPFRYSDQNLMTVNPNEEQLKEIARKYEKQGVTVEE